jgi:hypothetical protein
MLKFLRSLLGVVHMLICIRLLFILILFALYQQQYFLEAVLILLSLLLFNVSYYHIVVVHFLLSFVLICRRPRGTGFLKFSAASAAEAAVTASNAAPGLGIVIKGRALKVTKAIDKESAQKKEAEKAKSEVEDRRNLYLAKVESSYLYIALIKLLLKCYSIYEF